MLFFVSAVLCSSACGQTAQTAPDPGADWFSEFINRAFMLFVPNGKEVVVLADSGIDVWGPKWFCYSNLKEGDSFDLSDEDSQKTFVVRRIGVDSVEVDYAAEIIYKNPPSRTSISGRFESRYSPDWAAVAYFGLEPHMRKLIDEGLDVNSTDSFGRTPLMIAAFCGHEKLCRALLRAGADINAAQEDGITALMLAVKYPDIAERFIKEGADVDAADSQGRNVLVYALNEPETMRLLIEEGKVKLTGPASDQALMRTIRFGSPECLQLMVDNGADVNARVDNVSMLRWAIKERRDRAIGILMTAGAEK